MKTILFVCTGNICRSPMAVGLFEHAAKGRYRVLSAGLGAMDGIPASDHAVRALKELGIDISSHRSQRLTPGLVQQSDYIFGMTQGHVESIAMLYPQSAEKTFVLREFDDTLEEFEKDISDPIGGSLETYRLCRDQIEQGISSMLKFIEPTEGAVPARVIIRNIAVGADHGGFELKESVKKHLQAGGWAVTDYGASCKEPGDDYPDFALAVAHSVADRKNDVGLLFCTSGIGMSITANKVAGVRAALVSDEESAAQSRRHNNANVLCLSAKHTPEQACKMVEAFLATLFEGGRHDRRVSKIEAGARTYHWRLESVDPEIFQVVQQERERQQENIELIASENFTSPAVMEAQGSVRWRWQRKTGVG